MAYLMEGSCCFVCYRFYGTRVTLALNVIKLWGEKKKYHADLTDFNSFFCVNLRNLRENKKSHCLT